MSRYSIESRSGRVLAAKERHEVLQRRLLEDPDLSAQDAVKLAMEARQTEIHMRQEEGFVAPIDREWIDEQVKRAEEAAERIHGGRPRRVSPPGPAEPTSTKH